MGNEGKFRFVFVMRLVKSVDQSPRSNFGYLEKLVVPSSTIIYEALTFKRKREFPAVCV